MGNPLNSNCIVSIVDGVESNDVLIRWTGPGVSMDRFIMGNITFLGSNTYSRTLRLDYLLKTDEGINHYFCIATILEASAIESFELDSLAGKYVNINCFRNCTIDQLRLSHLRY